jgi:hypothetical protein
VLIRYYIEGIDLLLHFHRSLISINSVLLRTASPILVIFNKKLLSLLADGSNWREISQALLGRNEESCKNRYYKHLSKQLWKGSNIEELLSLYYR